MMLGRLWRLLLLLLTLQQPGAAWPEDVAAGQPAPGGGVLMLVSSGYGNPGVDRYVASVYGALRAQNFSRGNVHIEYLDLSAGVDAMTRQRLRDYLLTKYATTNIDAVVCFQQAALNFLLRDGKALAPGAPVMSAYATPAKADDVGNRQITLLTPMPDYLGTVKLALQLLPKTERVVIFADSSENSLQRMEQVKSQLKDWREQLPIEDTRALGFEDALQRLAKLPANTIVVGIGYSRNQAGQGLVYAESIRVAAKAANAPLFATFDVTIGDGVTGGMVVRVSDEANSMTKTIVDAMAGGNNLASIKPHPSRAVPMFDWLELERWHLDPSKLPAETMFLNQPPTLWGQFKEYVVINIAVMLILLGLVSALLMQNRRRKAAVVSMRESEARFRVLVEQAPEAILVYDPDARQFVDANPNAERLFDCDRATLLSGNPRRFFASIRLEAFAASLQRVLAGEEVIEEHVVHTNHGRELLCEVHIVRLPSAGKNLLRTSFIDITERRAAEEKVAQLAYFDPLTQLPNRRLMTDRLHQALIGSVRSKQFGALLLIDLDHFKTINDTIGHEVGDALLRLVAHRITSILRESDSAARLGGDEFVVMLERLGQGAELATTQAALVAGKVLAALTEPYDLSGRIVRSSASIGVTLFNEQPEVAADVLKRADLAMGQAKTAGRSDVRFYDPELQAQVTARVELEADMRAGLLGGQFIVHLQPQVDLQGRVTGAEALVRWQHPLRGLVPPFEFVPLAEETGLIVQLGHRVLEVGCMQLADWARYPATAHLTLAVNVSARQFRHADFVDQVMALLARSGADPRKLKLELTESLMVDNVEDIIVKMNLLKEQGLSFSLDDFGTGYSSLSYLKRLPLYQLKIDQSFVRDVLTDPNDAAIATTIVALGQSLGLAVIAEGVENEGQRDFLARNGCHAFQGYLFSRPLSQEAFAEFVSRHQ